MKRFLLFLLLSVAALHTDPAQAGGRNHHYGYAHGHHRHHPVHCRHHHRPVWYGAHNPSIVVRTAPAIAYMVAHQPPAYGITPPAANGRYCREYQSAVRVGNRLQPGYGQACYQPDGSWELVD